mmetsp:Transcript_81968/g.240635  ORF Transcript_81968/g.240635 Transcript_81968/m.240635 type:complete len:234 (-) Transcript_81968:151-852(-)
MMEKRSTTFVIWARVGGSKARQWPGKKADSKRYAPGKSGLGCRKRCEHISLETLVSMQSEDETPAESPKLIQPAFPTAPTPTPVTMLGCIARRQRQLNFGSLSGLFSSGSHDIENLAAVKKSSKPTFRTSSREWKVSPLSTQRRNLSGWPMGLSMKALGSRTSLRRCATVEYSMRTPRGPRTVATAAACVSKAARLAMLPSVSYAALMARIFSWAASGSSGFLSGWYFSTSLL